MVSNDFMESLGFCRKGSFFQNQPVLKEGLHEVKISFCEMSVEFRHLFRNEKEAKKHEIIVPNVYVRIYPNGDILYSIRYVRE